MSKKIYRGPIVGFWRSLNSKSPFLGNTKFSLLFFIKLNTELKVTKIDSNLKFWRQFETFQKNLHAFWKDELIIKSFYFDRKMTLFLAICLVRIDIEVHLSLKNILLNIEDEFGPWKYHSCNRLAIFLLNKHSILD